MMPSRTRPSFWTLFVGVLAVVWLVAAVVVIAIGRGDVSYALAIPGAALLFLAFYSYDTDRIN